MWQHWHNDAYNKCTQQCAIAPILCNPIYNSNKKPRYQRLVTGF